jgi:small subunit ribosomal protein S16
MATAFLVGKNPEQQAITYHPRLPEGAGRHQRGGKTQTMSVRIRLARGGRKKRPFYHVVVASSEAPRDGRFIERLGTYNPLTEPAHFKINPARLQYWLQEGAKPTDTVCSLIRKHAAREVAQGS